MTTLRRLPLSVSVASHARPPNMFAVVAAHPWFAAGSLFVIGLHSKSVFWTALTVLGVAWLAS